MLSQRYCFIRTVAYLKWDKASSQKRLHLNSHKRKHDDILHKSAYWENTNFLCEFQLNIHNVTNLGMRNVFVIDLTVTCTSVTIFLIPYVDKDLQLKSTSLRINKQRITIVRHAAYWTKLVFEPTMKLQALWAGTKFS